MNKEQQELVNEAYIKYQNQTMFHTDDLVSLKELDGMYMSTGEKTKVYRQFAPKEFINKCKTDTEFSEKWGLKIEERELIQGERLQLLWKVCREENIPPDSKELEDFWLRYNEIMSKYNIPTQLITITYQTKTKTIYE
jgi:hypothetical protein